MAVEPMRIVPKTLKTRLAMNAFAVLVKADCPRNPGIFSDGRKIEVANAVACARLRPGIPFSTLDKVALLESPIAASAAAARSCAESGRVPVGASDGREADVACTPASARQFEEATQVIQLSTDEVAKTLFGARE
jgi:hypothetical protein